MTNTESSPVLPLEPLSEAPTRVRYGVLAYLCALSFILYLDRVCIGKAAPLIEKELGLTHTQMSFAFSAFTLAYTLFEVVTGAWGDKYGARGVLTRIVIVWSIFTALTGSVPSFSWDTGVRFDLPWLTGWEIALLFNSLSLLVLIRFLFGAGEAGAFPNVASVLARWFPQHERGKAQGLVLTFSLLGGAASPTVAAYLINAEMIGWRWAFVIFGLTGVVWAIAFRYWFRDSPADHPAVNDAERRLIFDGTTSTTGTGTHPKIPWAIVLTCPSMWLLGSVIACAAFTAYMIMAWYPTYLEQGRGVDEITAGWLASLVLGGGAVGCYFGGYLSGWAVRISGERRRSRRLIGIGTLTAGGVLLAASPHFESPVATSVCAALAFACAQAQQGNWWATVTDISGKHLGAMFGLMNSLGGIGAIASPIFLARFVDARSKAGLLDRDQWDPAFLIYGIVLFVGASCWLLIEPDKPIAEQPPSPEAKPLAGRSGVRGRSGPLAG